MPDVLAFQESHDGVHLSGYVRFEVPVEAAVRGPRASKPVHTFVRRGIPTIQHEPVVDNVPHILLELLPRRKEQRRVFLLNVYSPPKDQSKAVARILAEVLRVAKDTPLLVVGDFNANHAEWGHLHTLPKALSLQECVDEHDYTILNDFRYPTRIGNSVSKNTSPDLSMTRMIGEVSWTNTGVSLGSDHYVLEMLMPVEGISALAKRKVLVTDWDAFRRNRDASAPTTIEDLCGWTDDLLSSAELVTVESDASSTSGVSDSKLEHMWQAHRSLQARPISLTSCLGKLLEHVILNRLQAYVEDRDLLPHTMFGFRAHLSTQDVFLQLSQDIVEKKRGMQALLALDLQKAFDNVKHEVILSRISRLHLGLRTFAYLKSFLTGRTAQIRLGEDVSPTFRACVGRGTPQGAVLSPLLFNFAMMDLPEKLTVIPGLRHSLYADDVTLWTEGHVLHVQSALQTAADVVVDYARSVGLECSHAKSELLVKRGYHERIFQDDVQVLVNGNHISESDSVRVLGMHLRKDLSNADAVLRIGKTAKSTARLIKRIANKRGGVKEGDVCRIVHAFVVSRVLYTVPYMRLTTTDKKKLDSIIRQVYKLALGLPMATSTDRLMQLGIHNTVSELVEAHRSSQI
ncbi:hypothetical protein ISCGN_007212, partial [Ixodes scapularis]